MTRQVAHEDHRGESARGEEGDGETGWPTKQAQYHGEH